MIGSASFGRERFIGLYSRGRSGRFLGFVLPVLLI